MSLQAKEKTEKSGSSTGLRQPALLMKTENSIHHLPDGQHPKTVTTMTS